MRRSSGATMDLLAHTSFAGLSMEAVAKRAGVGKPTLYRRWLTKAALVADALAWSAPEIHLDVGGDLRSQLRRGLIEFGCSLMASDTGHVLYSLMGEVMMNPQLGDTLRARYLRPRQDVIDAALRRGIDAGLLRADIDSRLMQSLLLGPMAHTWLTEGTPLDEQRAGQLFDAAWKAISTD